MTETKPRGSSQHMTEFGRTLYSLMLTRGIERQQDLSRILNDTGYKISQASLSYYMNGRRVVDPLFVACVTEMLDLNKEEKRRLESAYSYGQLRPTEEDRELLERFRALKL